MLDKNSKTGLYLVSPTIVGLILFIIFPIIFSFSLTFYEWDGLSAAKYVGFNNYIKLNNDSLFWKSLRVTLIYTAIALPLNIIISFILALFLSKDTWLNQILRFSFYVPQLIAGIPLLLLWLWIFNTKYGLLNHFLDVIGIQGPSWFENESSAFIAMIIISLWGIGNNLLIFLATFQRIPSQLFEVISLESNTLKYKLKYVIFPYSSPIIFFLTIVGFIGYAQTFSQAYVITQGGPNNATLFFTYYVYQSAFSFFKMGYASAMAWIFFFILLIITAIQFLLSKFWVSYDEVKLK